MATLTALNAKVAALLQTVPALVSLKIEHFGSVEDISALLAKYKSRLPGAFFSPVTTIFSDGKSIDGSVRTTDAGVKYLLLVAIASRATGEDRQDILWPLGDAVLSALNLAPITRAGMPVSSVPDFLRLTRMDYADEEDLSAVLIEFSIAVRNWQP